MKKNIIQLFLGMVLIVLIAISFAWRADTTKAQTTTISDDQALELALSYSLDDGLVGGSMAPPEKVYGQAMTYNEAIQFVFSKPIDPNTKEYKKQTKIVWLIVLEGKFVEHVPPSAGGDVPATEVVHNQMVIILDGKTGEIMRRVLLPSQTKLLVTNLPILRKTDGVIPEMPTGNPISTEIPYPTLTPPSP